MADDLKSTLLRILALLALLYCFLIGLQLMGISFKLFGKGFAETLIAQTSNPFVGLFVGVLATSLIQSSSTTTSMVVALVAAGGLTVEGAIPVIMGANIGTSVTNTIVSLGHVTRPEEFRRAFAGATVHDFFNWMAVLILLPVEIYTGYLAKVATKLELMLEGVGGIKLFNPINEFVKPVAKWITHRLGDSGALALILGLILLFVALRYLVVILRALLSGQTEQLLHKTLFRSPFVAIVAGVVVTVMVQSSSITTSTVVPLVGAGVITLEQIFPFTIGANIGTTVTAMLAALATGNPAAVTVAFAHLMFNITGTILIYPLQFIRNIPLAMARKLGDVAVKSRASAIAYVMTMFYGIPLILLLVTGAGGEKAEVAQQPLNNPTNQENTLLESKHA